MRNERSDDEWERLKRAGSAFRLNACHTPAAASGTVTGLYE